MDIHTNRAIINFIDDGVGDIEYEHIHQTIINGSVSNMYLVISKGNFGAIYAKDSSCHGYCIIKSSLSLYTLKENVTVDGKFICYSEIVCGSNYFYPINVRSHYYVYSNMDKITTIILCDIINGHFKVNIYSVDGVLTFLLK